MIMGTVAIPDSTLKADQFGLRTSRTASQNRASLEAALAEIPDDTGGSLVIPSADEPFLVEYIPALTKGKNLRGTGMRGSVLKISDPDVDGLTMHGASAASADAIIQTGISDLTILGPGSWNFSTKVLDNPGTGVGLNAQYLALGARFERVRWSGWKNSVLWDNSYSASFIDCQFDGASDDHFSAATNCNQLHFIGCIFINTEGKHVAVVGGVAGLLLNCTLESAYESAVDLRYCDGWALLWNNYENNGRDGTSPIVYVGRRNAGEPSSNCGVVGGNMSGSDVSDIGVRLDYSLNCFVDRVRFRNIVTTEIDITANAIIAHYDDNVTTYGSGPATTGTPRVVDAGVGTSSLGTSYENLNRTVKPGLVFQPGSAPAQLAEGLVWMQSSDHQLKIRDNTRTKTLPGALLGTASLSFPTVNAQSCQELTISVTSAAAGDKVALSVPPALEAGLQATARVSTTNTVTVRLCNITASNISPATGSYQVYCFK